MTAHDPQTSGALQRADDDLSLRRLRHGLRARTRRAISPAGRTPARRRTDGRRIQPVRLMNGLYLQLHAYMLRIAIPYGTLSARQLRMLAHIARKYDKGYGHFTTRQNIQFNWPSWSTCPTFWTISPSVEMHAIQTSRQLHPQCHRRSFRRRRRRRDRRPAPVWPKFCGNGRRLHPGIHLPAAQIQDRGQRRARTTAPRSRSHDIGLRIHRNDEGEIGYEVYRRRRPRPLAVHRPRPCATSCRSDDLLAYLEAILRVYNLSAGATTNTRRASRSSCTRTASRRCAREVEAEFAAIGPAPLAVTPRKNSRASRAYFAPPPL